MSEQPATPSTSSSHAIPAIPCLEIFGRAGRIAWTYAWSLVLAKFVVDIPYSLISTGIQDPMIAFRFSSFYELFVSGFVSLGIYRCILRLEAEGTAPTFAETYSLGIRYYSRNFRMTMLFGCYLLPIALACFILLAPGLWLNANQPEHPALPWCLAAGVLVSVVLVFWWLARTSFHNAVLCDEAKGAVDAMDKTLALTKGNVGTLLPICILQGMLFAFVTSATTFVRGAIDGSNLDLTRADSSLIDLVLLVPTTCLEVFMIATLALVYVHFRKYARPMPVE